MNETLPPAVKKKLPLNIFLIGIILLLALVAIVSPVLSFYFYDKYRKPSQVIQNTTINQSEADGIVASVRKLMDLPSEEPTVATVSDIERLKTQPFFRRAQNGDKVIIYQSLSKAILYRPSINKIIDVATMNVSTSPKPSSLTPSPTKTAQKDSTIDVVIWNGTTTLGITKSSEDSLKAVADIVVTVDEDGSSKRNYEKTIVINTGDVAKDKVSEIASKLDGSVASMPQGEKASEDVDIIVILGRDKIK